jgi:hypothetical protein
MGNDSGIRCEAYYRLCYGIVQRVTCTNTAQEPIFAMKKNIWRPVIEVAFIVFLFYSNLLMGEFERSGMGSRTGFVWALRDIFTSANFAIALIAAFIGYMLFEFLRKKL